ncbi:MAG: MerR family transcriptional regulator [Firmicutes bacterium]|nr:MerR family transcriptional regulator [Bacillota bacterium]MCL5038736.1 MerR family transcriptional regulator [Bacillota bacterium]
MDRPSQDLPIYAIGAVEDMTGLSGRRIRYYEKMGLISTPRTEGNQRLYSPAAVEKLKEIKRLLAAGMKLTGIKALLAEEKTDGRTGLSLEPAEMEKREAEPERDVDFLTNAITSLYPVKQHGALQSRLERGKEKT